MEHLLNLLELVSFPHVFVNEDKIIMGIIIFYLLCFRSLFPYAAKNALENSNIFNRSIRERNYKLALTYKQWAYPCVVLFITVFHIVISTGHAFAKLIAMI